MDDSMNAFSWSCKTKEWVTQGRRLETKQVSGSMLLCTLKWETHEWRTPPVSCHWAARRNVSMVTVLPEATTPCNVTDICWCRYICRVILNPSRAAAGWTLCEIGGNQFGCQSASLSTAPLLPSCVPSRGHGPRMLSLSTNRVRCFAQVFFSSVSTLLLPCFLPL